MYMGIANFGYFVSRVSATICRVPLWVEPTLKILSKTTKSLKRVSLAGLRYAAMELCVRLLFGLEANWVGDAAANTNVLATLTTCQLMEADFPSVAASNWRLQALLFRSYFDAYVQTRYRLEAERELSAYAEMAVSVSSGSVESVAAVLRRNVTSPLAQAWKGRLSELAALINASSTLCGGCESGGMMVLQSQIYTLSLDTIDTPLTDAAFLLATLSNISNVRDVRLRQAMLQALVSYTDAGPGGFYDHLGSSPRNRRLVDGFGPTADPQYVFAPLIQFNEEYTLWPPCGACGAGNGSVQRLAWHRWAQVYGDQPLSLSYSGLEPAAQYRLRVVYSYQGWGDHVVWSLTAIGTDGTTALLHDFQAAPRPLAPQEWDVPRATTGSGGVTIQCRQPKGSAQNGNGRGCLISEVWLYIPAMNS